MAKTQAQKAKENKGKPRGRAVNKQYLAGLTDSQMKMYDIFFWATPVDLQDPEAKELKERIDLYRQTCLDLGLVPTFSDLAVALARSRVLLIQYRDGIVKCPKEVSDTLKRTSIWMEGALSQVGFNNPMYSTYVIWLQKNYFGYRDQIDVNVGAQNALPDNESAADVLKRRNFALNSLVTPQIEQHDVIDAEFKAVEATETVEVTADREVMEEKHESP